MKPIEGVDLGSLLSEVRGEITAEKKAEVARKVRGIYNDLAGWRRDLAKLDKEREKLDGKIKKAEGRLAEIEKGNWNVLDEQEKKEAPSQGE